MIDKDGHIKLSDFGLSTGFHKTHDIAYYQRLLSDDSKVKTSNVNTNTKSGNQEKLFLTLSRQDKLATWKKNRRELVFYTFLFCVYNRHIRLLEPLIILRQKFLCKLVMGMNVIGGLLGG